MRRRRCRSYDAPDRAGRTAGRTDTYRGRFAQLVPHELCVEVGEFESDDPALALALALAGEMTITIRLSDAPGGTQLDALHEGLPDAVAPADHEAGWRESLSRLAALVERGS